MSELDENKDVLEKLKSTSSVDPSILKRLEGVSFSLKRCTLKELTDVGLELSDAWKVHVDITKLKEKPNKGTKVISDPVLGHIEVPAPLLLFIDTPQFQRLRDIRQLGAGYHVFPGADHHRFEHSLGVSHLAGKFVRQLQRLQPELGISEVDLLCVQLAGLLHDLGHGPFSHLFDGSVIPTLLPDSKKLKHEDLSIKMFDHMLEVNELDQKLKKYGIEETDLLFVKELISGPSGGDGEYKGRDNSKKFLYEIVANKRSGIDVDKWDYFARDCHHLGIRNNFDHDRFIKFARVIMVDGELQICFRDKEATTLYDMFHTRKTLYSRAYRHSAVTAIELMLSDAIVKANAHISIPGTDGKGRTIAECVNDMEAYTKLTDSIYYQILWSTTNELEPARRILQRLERRSLYKLIGQTQPPAEQTVSFEKRELRRWESEIANIGSIDKELLCLDVLKLDYGMKDGNPVDNVRFYSKISPHEAKNISKTQVSPMLPVQFQEMHLRLYFKGELDAVDHEPSTTAGITSERIFSAFSVWCEDNKFSSPTDRI